MTTTALAVDPQSERHEVVTPLAAARSRAGVAAIILAAAGIAWWATVERMTGMDAGPGTELGTLGWFMGTWTVMMAAMMLPSFAPIAAAYATTVRRRDPGPSLLFTAGYLLIWAVAGLLAYALFGLGKDLLGHQLAWHSAGRWLAAGVLGLAAIYQLSSPKRACLLRCRSALRSEDTGWDERRPLGLAMGIRNGAWCVGSSCALMAALFALGVMSIAWMALVAGIVTVEKLTPGLTVATAFAAGALALLAVGLVAAPDAVPGLVVPGGHMPPPFMRMG